MYRAELKPGTKLNNGKIQFTINSVKGRGSSCIVYSACFLDASGYSHEVYIKENYPKCATIKRTFDSLIWEKEEEKVRFFGAFENAYRSILELQSDLNLGNSTASVFDLFENNGTQYSIMDISIGSTYDCVIEQDSLSDTLKTILALAKTVGKYHEKGLLHLDIKPNNFLVIPETRELVILFDMDSVVPMRDIQSGTIKQYSYTEEWAAPEQRQGEVLKLSPASDIYAIGAILFYKVMGRHADCSDAGMFSRWKFDSSLFEEIDPKIKRQLTNIFRKTVSANPKRRYQNTKELVHDLEDAVATAREGRPYILSTGIKNTVDFVGREREVSHIHHAFKTGKKAIFLHGDGGIGKSTLAIAYGSEYSADYDAVVFLKYKDSLEELEIDLINHIQKFTFTHMLNC